MVNMLDLHWSICLERSICLQSGHLFQNEKIAVGTPGDGGQGVGTPRERTLLQADALTLQEVKHENSEHQAAVGSAFERPRARGQMVVYWCGGGGREYWMRITHGYCPQFHSQKMLHTKLPVLETCRVEPASFCFVRNALETPP